MRNKNFVKKGDGSAGVAKYAKVFTNLSRMKKDLQSNNMKSLKSMIKKSIIKNKDKF